jgi:hypothetical protein
MSSVIKILNSLNIKPQKRNEEFEEEEAKEIEVIDQTVEISNKQNQDLDKENEEIESKSFQVISSQKEITENEDLNLKFDFEEDSEADDEEDDFDLHDIVENYDGRTGKVYDIEEDQLIVINESGKIEKWKIKDVDLIRPS